MLQVISTRCVARDLHTIAPGPLERTCWRWFAALWGDCKKSQIAPLNAIIIIIIIKGTTKSKLTWIRKVLTADTLPDIWYVWSLGNFWFSNRRNLTHSNSNPTHMFMFKMESHEKHMERLTDTDLLHLSCVGGLVNLGDMYDILQLLTKSTHLIWVDSSGLFVVCCWLLNVPATCECISGTDLLSFTCCHTEIEAANQTFHLTRSQYTDTGPACPSTDPITPGAWQGSHWSAKFEVTGMTRPWKNPVARGIWTRDLSLSRRMPYPLSQRGGDSSGNNVERTWTV